VRSIAYYCIYKLQYDLQFKWRILYYFYACRLIINKLTNCCHSMSPRMTFHISCGTSKTSVTTLSIYCLFVAPVENWQSLLRVTLLILTWVILQCLLALLATPVPVVECRMTCGIATCVKIYFRGLVILWGFLVKHVGVRWRLKSRHPRVSRTESNKLLRIQRHWCRPDFLYTDKMHASGISDFTQKRSSIETLCHSSKPGKKNIITWLPCNVNVNRSIYWSSQEDLAIQGSHSL
jgi:hypothetical protein